MDLRKYFLSPSFVLGGERKEHKKIEKIFIYFVFLLFKKIT